MKQTWKNKVSFHKKSQWMEENVLFFLFSPQQFLSVTWTCLRQRSKRIRFTTLFRSSIFSFCLNFFVCLFACLVWICLCVWACVFGTFSLPLQLWLLCIYWSTNQYEGPKYWRKHIRSFNPISQSYLVLTLMCPLIFWILEYVHYSYKLLRFIILAHLL